MIRRYIVLAHVLAVCAFAAPAQTVSALSAPITQDDLNAAAATNLTLMQSFACAPGTTVPQPEAVGGAVGTSGSCVRSDAKVPRITRAVKGVTDSNGLVSVTWADALLSPPIIVPVPLVASGATQAPMCDPVQGSITTTGATVKCWTTQSVVVGALGATVAPVTAAAAGVPVQVFAIPVTQ